jgi:transposase
MIIDTYVYFIVFDYEFNIETAITNGTNLIEGNVSTVKNLDFKIDSQENITKVRELLIKGSEEHYKDTDKFVVVDVNINNFILLDSYNKEEREAKDGSN